ncbi:enoyl-CoA hydratase-related protein [Photobacterium sp. TY1-4]|uniref:enoyl-CoA hydratase-related protein n=1 Tax=Photobacterium sp. TY1-4 TaxID=2899122 RepID=UPI0021C18A0C|nr:enoyl-CoA hydratase-related protein [Photobacterium sp. TY1-4]UXI04015.1 enoyl-CoA hydratase-related protein [Photobacterium sp. TY1-4]
MTQQHNGKPARDYDPGHWHCTADAEVLCTVTESGIATLTFNRVSKHNAFHAAIIQSLLGYLRKLKHHPGLRVLLLKANGKHFSAGADLEWMMSMAEHSVKKNRADALELAALLYELDTFPTPTIAQIQGSAFGGALGLICCCDIAVASPDARFCLSEVRIGLLPATIGPYVCRTIGQRQARRYMLTAESMDATTAQQLGLLHEISEQPETRVEELVALLLENSPQSLAQTKLLCQLCDQHEIDPALMKKTSQLIADIRVSPEGQEGLAAFFARRPPAWSPRYE